MKFQRMKDMICGALIASMVLCSGTVAFAKVANTSIPVMYNNIKIIVDGQQLQTSKEPFIYEGTTYLPIRAVAEAVGKDVSWDNATKTVTLGSTKGVTFTAGHYTAGKDFEAGKYNVVCTNDAGTVSSSNYISEGGLSALMASSAYLETHPRLAGTYIPEYSNCTFPEGAVITISGGATIKLVPVE